MMLIHCFAFAFTLLTADGAPIHSVLYWTNEACQSDADAFAAHLGIATQRCYRYDFCYPQS